MKLLAALKSDFKFQFKHGFYFVYAALTAIYLLILHFIPAGIVKSYAVPLTIYSDPAVVGFFFIGSIVMLEKQQGIIDCLAVTPLSPKEYLFSKVITLSAVGAISSIVIAASAEEQINWLVVIVSVLMNSFLYTLFGFIVAGGAKSVNGYFMRAIPMMLLMIIPCFSLIGFKFARICRIFPSTAGLELLIGSFIGIDLMTALTDSIILCLWIALLYSAALKTYDKKILAGGGNNE